MQRSVPLLIVCAIGLALCGCAGRTLAPVKGRVMFNGKPVKEASVTFAPVTSSEGDKEPGKPATGITDNDGYFVLSTYKPHDGALTGSHKVTVWVDDTNPAKCNRTKELTFEVKPGDNEFEIEMDSK